MKDEFFVDTNILVYAFDTSEKHRHEGAKKIVKEISEGKYTGIISNQVLAELFAVLTKKIDKPITGENAQVIVNGLLDSTHWKKINYNSNTVSRAVESSIKEKMHFWDALIIETMLENKAYKIITENTKDFKSKIIAAVNPFS